jgi:hypothetical protein
MWLDQYPHVAIQWMLLRLQTLAASDDYEDSRESGCKRMKNKRGTSYSWWCKDKLKCGELN